MHAIPAPPLLLLPLPRRGEVLCAGQRGHEHPLRDGRGRDPRARRDGDAIVRRGEDGVVVEVVDPGGEEVQQFQLRDCFRGGGEHAERYPDLCRRGRLVGGE